MHELGIWSFQERHPIDQEASSHAIATRSPHFKRGEKRRRKCIFVDDEAALEEGSNHLQSEDDVKGDESQEMPVEAETSEDAENEDLTESDGIVKPNLGHEICMFQKFGIANKASILARLTREDRKWAEIEMTVESRLYQGVSPSYNSPCVLISQLVWKDDFNAFISKKTSKLKALGVDNVDFERRLQKATKQEEARLKDRGYKFLTIANLAHGEEFFELLFDVKWDDPSM
ncbi:hypothetical protein L7F22_018375, partial [Adiantum nelumboides]|nr:hypothetical protein [Adiantum nelumboides]